jgi:hypothetical protein
LSAINEVNEQDEVIRKIYCFKLEAIMNYNRIFILNQDTFNNSEYLSWYNNSKRNLESEIAKYETNIIDKNLTKSYEHCMNLLNDYYNEVIYLFNNT